MPTTDPGNPAVIKPAALPDTVGAPSPPEIKPASLMAWLFDSAEYTPLFVVTFLSIVCLGAWTALAIWGSDTPRVANLIDTLGKSFTFFIGLFSGLSIAGRGR